MAHVVKKNGKKILYVFYDKSLDDYDEQTEKALREHGLENEPINIICRPYKKNRSNKEVIKSIYNQLRDMREKIEGENREPTHAECMLANSKLARVAELESQL